MVNEGLLLDELEIIIQKQLSNSAINYKRLGIIGGVALIKRLGKV